MSALPSDDLAYVDVVPKPIKRPMRREGARECLFVIGGIFVLFAILYAALAWQAGTWGL